MHCLVCNQLMNKIHFTDLFICKNHQQTVWGQTYLDPEDNLFCIVLPECRGRLVQYADGDSEFLFNDASTPAKLSDFFISNHSINEMIEALQLITVFK